MAEADRVELGVADLAVLVLELDISVEGNVSALVDVSLGQWVRVRLGRPHQRREQPGLRV